MHRFIMLALVSSFACASSAHGQYYGGEAELSLTGYRDHTGLYSHVGLGLGYASAQGEDAISSADVSQSGVAYQVHFALGGSVIPRLAVHFSYFGFDSFGTTLKVDGREVKGRDTDVQMSGIGAGTTYYFPFNMFVSGSAGIAFVSLVDETGGGARLDPGFGMMASTGYEWWASADWGLGVALCVSYFRATDDTEVGRETWSGFAVGPQFSATMN